MLKKIVDMLKVSIKQSESMSPSLNRDVLRFVKSISLSCVRCGNRSAPVKGTSNTYQCAECGKTFSGPDHQVESAIWRASKLTAAQKVHLKQNYELYARHLPKPEQH